VGAGRSYVPLTGHEGELNPKKQSLTFRDINCAKKHRENGEKTTIRRASAVDMAEKLVVNLSHSVTDKQRKESRGRAEMGTGGVGRGI